MAHTTCQFTVLQISVNINRLVLIEARRLRVRRSSTGREDGCASVIEVTLPLGKGSSKTCIFLIMESTRSTQEVSDWRCRRHEIDPNL
jgi:hypothetical protein